MSCPNEIELERMVFVQLRGEELPLFFREHLNVCAFCRENYQALWMLYKDAFWMMKTEALPISPYHLRTGSNNGWLRAYHLQKKEARIEEDEITVLAAETEQAGVPEQLINIGSYITRDGDILVRVLQDRQTDEVTLYLISREKKKYSNVLVRIQGLEGEYPSDEMGQVKIGKVKLPNPEELTIEIKTALSTFFLSSLSSIQEEILAQSEFILQNDKNDSIKLELIPSESRYVLKIQVLNLSTLKKGAQLRVLVSRSNKEPLIEPVRKGVAIFEQVDGAGELRIQIFE